MPMLLLQLGLTLCGLLLRLPTTLTAAPQVAHNISIIITDLQIQYQQPIEAAQATEGEALVMGVGLDRLAVTTTNEVAPSPTPI